MQTGDIEARFPDVIFFASLILRFSVLAQLQALHIGECSKDCQYQTQYIFSGVIVLPRSCALPVVITSPRWDSLKREVSGRIFPAYASSYWHQDTRCLTPSSNHDPRFWAFHRIHQHRHLDHQPTPSYLWHNQLVHLLLFQGCSTFRSSSYFF